MSRTYRALMTLWLLVALGQPTLAVAQNNTATADELRRQLESLNANPETADKAAYEQLIAQQAITALAQARSRDTEQALYLAQKRVEIARARAHTEAMQQHIRQLEKRRYELRIEAYRRENARIHQDVMRLQMQIQGLEEDNQQLRTLIETETIARQDAQTALSRAVGRQAARANAAQQEAARLAREEAELLANAPLPSSSFTTRGEVFNIAAEVWNGERAELSEHGRNQMRALGEYLNIGKRGRISIDGYGATAKERAQALRDALVNNGVSASRIQSSTNSRGAATTARTVEVIVTP